MLRVNNGFRSPELRPPFLLMEYEISYFGSCCNSWRSPLPTLTSKRHKVRQKTVCENTSCSPRFPKTIVRLDYLTSNSYSTTYTPCTLFTLPSVVGPPRPPFCPLYPSHHPNQWASEHITPTQQPSLSPLVGLLNMAMVDKAT